MYNNKLEDDVLESKCNEDKSSLPDASIARLVVISILDTNPHESFLTSGAIYILVIELGS